MKLSEECTDMIERWTQIMQVALALEAAGYAGSIYGGTRPRDKPWITVPVESLAAIRHATGHLKAGYRYATGPDRIAVTLSCEKLPGIMLRYEKPYVGDGRCRIVKTDFKCDAKPAESERIMPCYTLVCPT